MRVFQTFIGAFFLGAVGAFAAEHPLPVPPEDHVRFSADHFDYDGSSGVVHLRGHVRLEDPHREAASGMSHSSTVTVKSDELWLNLNTRRVRSEGYLFIHDGYSAVSARSGEFDFQSRSGTFEGSSAAHGEWNLQAKHARLDKDGRLWYRSARFTGCSESPRSHYHFSAGSVRVIPKRYLLAYNCVLYIGGVPVFYTPVLFKSLRERHFLRFKLQPGFDRRNGAYLKTTLLNEHGPHLYSKLFLDYYTGQGFGGGGELHRRRDEDSRGTLFGYRIRENQGNKRERWALLGDAYQGLISSVAFQGRFQIQSDADFNNDYARSSAFRVTPELHNSAALVYRRPALTARLSVSRVDIDNGSRAKFIKARDSLPRLDIQTAPLRWGRLPWLNTVNAFADNSYDRPRGFTERSAGAAWEGFRAVPLVRGISLTPRVGYRQTYLSRFDALTSLKSTTTVLDTFVGRYLAEGALRVASPVGDWDLIHRYERRHKAGKLADDSGALDHGVESNLMTLQDTLRPSRDVLVRLASGYDFRRFRDRDLGFRRRVEPFVSEVTWTPRTSLHVSVRDDYHLEDGHRSFLLSGQWGESDANFIGGSVSQNIATPRSTFVGSEAGWTIHQATGNWRFSGALRGEVYSLGGLNHIHSFRLFEKEILIARTFHDFFARALMRFRPGGVREIFVRLDMKLGSLERDRAPRRDWEAEWFPERQKGIEDRP